MDTRRFVRPVAIALAVAVAASPAVAYIHFPPTTMPKMCKDSTNIRVLRAKKHDKEKGVIVYEVAETLKGANPKGMSFRHAIRGEAARTKPILDWVGDGKKAVMFTIEVNDIARGYVFIDEFCYSVDYNAQADFWLLIRVDPELSATFHGSAEQLRNVARDLLDGKEVKVPMKPSAKALTVQEREKQVPAINDILAKNRGSRAAFAQEKPTPEQAKEALLAMMRSKAGQELGWFNGDVPDEMARMKIEEEKDGWYVWTAAFRFNPSKAVYTFVVRPKPAARACVFEYEGSFVKKDGAWSATPPKLVRTVLQPGE